MVGDPNTGEHSPEHIPDINLVSLRSYEMFMTSSEEKAGTHVWDVPGPRLVEPRPLGSLTRSNAREQAASRYLKEVREDGETDFL